MEAGRLSRVDYTQLQSQYEQDHYNLVNARGTFYTRRMELKRLLQLGIDSTMEIVPVHWDKPEVMAELPPMDESYSMAVDTDIRIQALKLQKESATADIDICRCRKFSVSIAQCRYRYSIFNSRPCFRKPT